MSSQAPVRELQFSLCAVNKPQGCTILKNYLGLPTVLVGKVLQLVVSDF